MEVVEFSRPAAHRPVRDHVPLGSSLRVASPERATPGAPGVARPSPLPQTLPHRIAQRATPLAHWTLAQIGP
jgi:hypothetical protein